MCFPIIVPFLALSLPCSLSLCFLSLSLAAVSLRYDSSYWLDHLRHLRLMTRPLSALRTYDVYYKSYCTYICTIQASHRGSRPGFIVAPSHFVLLWLLLVRFFPAFSAIPAHQYTLHPMNPAKPQGTH
ncbi:hypothetical protein PENSPDRAFT_59427 [Peniophora sp. CONT]|nr:hypothetical protein PENSPDRAFT_59427 [Peniophora sp. CONT]